MQTWFEPSRFGDTALPTARDAWPWEPVEVDAAGARAVRRHVERHLGPIDAVFVERCPDRVLVTVLHLARGDAHLLVTCGMSSLAMPPGDPSERPRRAELVLGLPRGWPMEIGRFAGPHAWPIDLLTALARHPHKARVGVGPGQTVANGRPPAPFGPTTAFCGVLLRPAVELPAAFGRLVRDDGEVVDLLAVSPLLADELRLARRLGTLVLLDLLEARGVGLVLDPARRAVTAGASDP